jgi:hypothetical protein
MVRMRLGGLTGGRSHGGHARPGRRTQKNRSRKYAACLTNLILESEEMVYSASSGSSREYHAPIALSHDRRPNQAIPSRYLPRSAVAPGSTSSRSPHRFTVGILVANQATAPSGRIGPRRWPNGL